MKKPLLTLLLVLFSLFGRAQSQPAPFKSANVITVLTADSAATALHKMGLALVGQGYMVDKVDKEFLVLVSRPRQLTTYTAPIFLTIRISASPTAPATLRVMGDYVMATMFDVKFNPVEYPSHGLRGANSITFTELEKLAKLYPEGKLAYERH
ncbi:hypothetical protein [Hymenobacter sp. YC55]|uniref:hypothetical protein n=1 Tax=Hymenobacter sp. YC55 TaxID=3034019 RepID=UPI0023F9002A|nr:hypothetical protein [Hymenobacter sp. YC55]MDF7810948.1 hypothetical protein [Hymenobacter sp. YC55]